MPDWTTILISFSLIVLQAARTTGRIKATISNTKLKCLDVNFLQMCLICYVLYEITIDKYVTFIPIVVDITLVGWIKWGSN
jgi:hypothetical protein